MASILSVERGTIPNVSHSFRLGLYDPLLGLSGPITWVGQVYSGSPCDRRIMARVVDGYNRRAEADPALTYCVGIFPLEAQCTSSPICE